MFPIYFLLNIPLQFFQQIKFSVLCFLLLYRFVYIMYVCFICKLSSIYRYEICHITCITLIYCWMIKPLKKENMLWGKWCGPTVNDMNRFIQGTDCIEMGIWGLKWSIEKSFRRHLCCSFSRKSTIPISKVERLIHSDSKKSQHALSK